MCLTSAGELKTAKRNIYCWKSLKKGNRAIHQSHFVYEIGKEQKQVEIEKTGRDNVNSGYHSWRLFSPFGMRFFL